MEERLSLVEELRKENKRLKEENKALKEYQFKQENVDMAIIRWLSKNVNDKKKYEEDCDEGQIFDMLNTQKAVCYLLIWPIMEDKCFGGFMKLDKIEPAARELAVYYDSYLKEKLETIAKHFYDRYQDEKKYRKLKNVKEYSSLKNDTFWESLHEDYKNKWNNEKKLKLLLYVTYRYRNNIFHGSKNIKDWSKYDTQINYCLTVMMIITDCMRKNNIVIMS